MKPQKTKTASIYGKGSLRSLFLIMIVLLTLVLISLFTLDMLADGALSSLWQGRNKGVLLDRDTGEKTAYSLEIMGYDKIENDFIKNWVDSKRDQGSVNGQPVYYTLYNDEFDAPIDMYLYMPLFKEVAGDITVSDIRVNEKGKALVLNINSDNTDNTDNDAVQAVQTARAVQTEAGDVVFHVYVAGASEKAKAKTDRLFVNGEQYHCPGATFTRLNN